jgi:hypothetical protein
MFDLGGLCAGIVGGRPAGEAGLEGCVPELIDGSGLPEYLAAVRVVEQSGE